MNTYKITYMDRGSEQVFYLFAMSEKEASVVFEFNFGKHPEAKYELMRPATEEELNGINSAGAPHPRIRR